MEAPTRLTAFLGLTAIAFAIAMMGLFMLDPMGWNTGTGKNPLASIGGPFTLVNQMGKTVTQADFNNRFMLVYFGYTLCPDVCPMVLNIISDAMEKLGKDQQKVVPVFISVDPARDTPDKIRKYVAKFSPRLVGLTGTAKQIDAVTKAYKVSATKRLIKGRPKSEYMVDHSSFIYFIGPDGKYRAIFGNGTTPETMVKRMRSFF